MFAPLQIYKSQSIEQSLTPPTTPPDAESEFKLIHPWPEPETVSEELLFSKLQAHIIEDARDDDAGTSLQDVLLLHGPKQRYAHTRKHPIPSTKNEREMLVAVQAIGLNPIDWKAP